MEHLTAPAHDAGAAAPASPAPTLAITDTVDGSRSLLHGAIQILAAETDKPLPGAVAAWTIVRSGSETLRELQQDAPIRLLVDADGRIGYEHLPANVSESVVILVSHPGFLSASIVRTGGTRPIDWPAELRLQRAAPFETRVVDRTGMPVTGATVQHIVDDQPSGPISISAESIRPWVEMPTTDAEGRAVLSSFPGRNKLQASLGDLRSAWWSGVPGGVVELRLVATFRATGRAHSTGPKLPDDLRVRILARESEDYEPLMTCVVASDGSFASGPIPVLSVDSYVFILEGESLAQQRRDVRPPAPGSTVNVDFAPVGGVDLRVHVRGSRGEDVQGAFVSAHWNEAAAWQKIEQLTDADGIAVISGCRPGTIWIRARAKSCAPKLLPEVEYYEAPPIPIEVELDPAGRIEGICRDGDKPVADFDVHFWQGRPSSKTTAHVTNSTDGSFEIDEAPLGEVILLGLTKAGCRTEEVRVQTVKDDVARVVLEALPRIGGSGRVVAAASGTGIEGARVQLHVTSDLWKIARCGPAAVTDADGRFEQNGLIRGRNMVEVSAPGYASKKVEHVSAEGQSAEFGTIVLDEQRAFEVTLTSDEEFDCTKLTAQLSGENFSGDRRFASSCRLRYDSLDPGRYELRIQHDDGSSAFAYFELTTDQDRHLDIPWSTPTIPVEIVPLPGTELPQGCWLLASHRLATGENVPEYYPILPHRRLAIRKHAGVSRAVLQLEDPSGAMLALEAFEVAPESSETLVLRITDEAAVLLVKNREGQPIPGAVLSLFLPGDSTGWAITQSTDEHGTYTLQGFVPSELVVNVYHPPIGVLPSRRISLDRKQANEFVLDADLTLRARVQERGLALAGIEVDASDGYDIPFGLGKHASDPAGLAAWNAVGAGEYRLRVQQPGIWPAEYRVTLQEGSPPAPLEVRRRGGIEFHVQTNVGTDAEGALVDLYSTENHAWASEWLAQGLIKASSATLRTDDNGRVQVHGLPNGEFHYRVTSKTGVTLEAKVDVPPASMRMLEVTLP